MIISIQLQHPTPTGAHSLPQDGGLRLSQIYPWIWQREEGLHGTRTKEAQHHSFSTLLYLKQRLAEAALPWTAVMSGLPIAYPMGMAGSLHSTTQETASPLFPLDVL